MTTANEGMELTRVGPGTPMGELMRCYWIPAAMSSELVRDGAPMRLMLLGEKLIAFRDSAGRVGVMDHRCPHRCASLFLGRNEEGGHSLRLSRLEVRRRRQLPGYAEPAATGLQAEGEGEGLQGGGARRRRVGLHGLACRGAAAAGVRDPRHAGR